MPEAVARLTHVAHVAYDDFALNQLEQGAIGIEHDYYFPAIIGQVYREFPSLQRRWEAYWSDYETVMSEVVEASHKWISAALTTNRESLRSFERTISLPKNLASLHEAARSFETAIWRARDRYTEYIDGPRGYRRRENAVALQQVERESLDQVDNQFLRILFGHPDHRSLLRNLSESEQVARDALLVLFRELNEAISEFGMELSRDSQRFWRYPPIVLGAFGKLDVPTETVFCRYLLDIARLRSRSLWDVPSSVAGTILTATAIVVTGGWGAILLGAIDLGISGFSAARAFLDARENEIAGRAGTFGQTLTDHPTSYGPAALEAAAAIIASISIAAGTLKIFSKARKIQRGSENAQLPASSGLGDHATSNAAVGNHGVAIEHRGLAERATTTRVLRDEGTVPDRVVSAHSVSRLSENVEPSPIAAIDDDIAESFERLSDNRVGEVKTRRKRDLLRPKGGQAAEGFVNSIKPIEPSPLPEAERITGTTNSEWLDATNYPPAKDRRKGRSVTAEEQRAGIDPRLIGANRASTKKFLNEVRTKISNPNHQLHFLVEPEVDASGKVLLGDNGQPQFRFRQTTVVTARGEILTGRYPGGELGPIVQVGHQGSFASAVREQFMLEDAEFNIVGGATIETKGGFSAKLAVLISDVPVEVRTALQWESVINSATGVPYLAPGTVARSPIISPPSLPK